MSEATPGRALRPIEPLDVPGLPRPSRTVRAAGVLLVVSAPLTAATVVLSLIDGDYAEKTYFNAVDQGLIRNETSFAAVGSTAQLCCSAGGLAMAVAFLVFAKRTWSARNTVRLWIWVTGGFVLLCFGGPAGLSSADDGIQGVISAYPPWFLPVYRATGLAMCTCLLAAIILLTTRPANRFFQQPGTP